MDLGRDAQGPVKEGGVGLEVRPWAASAFAESVAMPCPPQPGKLEEGGSGLDKGPLFAAEAEQVGTSLWLSRWPRSFPGACSSCTEDAGSLSPRSTESSGTVWCTQGQEHLGVFLFKSVGWGHAGFKTPTECLATGVARSQGRVDGVFGRLCSRVRARAHGRWLGWGALNAAGRQGRYEVRGQRTSLCPPRFLAGLGIKCTGGS